MSGKRISKVKSIDLYKNDTNRRHMQINQEYQLGIRLIVDLTKRNPDLLLRVMLNTYKVGNACFVIAES